MSNCREENAKYKKNQTPNHWQRRSAPNTIHEIRTAINPGSTNDTLLLNLGRDKSIVVKRIKLKDKSRGGDLRGEVPERAVAGVLPPVQTL